MTLSMERNLMEPYDNSNYEFEDEIVVAEETKHELGLQAVMTAFDKDIPEELQHPDNENVRLGDQ